MGSTKKDNYNLIIEQYYNENQVLYSLFWSKDALHYGFWEQDTKTISEAVLNSTVFVCKCLEIDKNDVVLDAGCGVGGTSIYIAKKYGAKVYGITLSRVQLKTAIKKALKSNVADLTHFSKQDFTKTNFKDCTFSKVLGIESVCYAHKKISFLHEAFRLLEKGGKVAIMDGFLIRPNLNKREKEVYKKFINGWALPNLSMKDGFYDDLINAGFKNIQFHDKLKTVRKCCDRIYKLGIGAYPFTLFLSKMRIIPKNMHGHAIGCINQKKLVNHNMVTYGVFLAEK